MIHMDTIQRVLLEEIGGKVKLLEAYIHEREVYRPYV